MQTRRLLAVFAHPDDESFIVGGTLARYASQGVDVRLLTATHGDAGEAASVRDAELACAARELGLASFSFLDYAPVAGLTWRPSSPPPEGKSYLVTTPVEAVAEGVAEEIRRVRPQVVMTFDSTGATGHPDHVAIGRATRLAFERVVSERTTDGLQRLYAAVFGRTAMRWGVWALRLTPGLDPRRFGPARDVDLAAALAEAPRPTTYVDVRRWLGVRRRAVLCHRSQLVGAPWPLRRYELLPPWVRGAVFPREGFARVWPEAPANMRERDLFEGVVLGS